MKKLISLILILCMACMLIPAMADTDVTGTWYASMMGIPMTMTLNADGTGTMISPVQGGEAPAAWTMEGDKITITVNDSPATGTVTADAITLEESGMEIVFTREVGGQIYGNRRSGHGYQRAGIRYARCHHRGRCDHVRRQQ